MFPLPSITFPIYTWLSPGWRTSRNLVRSFVSEKIETARTRTGSTGDPADAESILDMLIQKEKQGGKALSENELLDELLLMFL